MASESESDSDSESAREEPPHKKVKTCILTKLEPDVTILVGHEEYQEYSQALCSWSDYFEKALTSGMRESESKRFEFPDRDPKEWEMIVAMMKPMTKVKVTDESVFKALSWFAELCSPQGLQESDSILLSLLEPSSVSHNFVLDILEASLNFCLPKSMAKSFAKVKMIMANNGAIMVEKAWVERFISVAQGHQNCLDAMWDTLGELVPATLSGQQRTSLLENGLLTEFVFTKMEALHFKKHHPAIKRMVSKLKKPNNWKNNNFSNAILKAMRLEDQDKPWQHLL
ncbi:expressed unknown protein [Seminavis robusta]|uniref:BTB domain-containing protein n=1 Tax=Seminavis robusta TaxID=568900 RepID=A0A9N8DQJ6_9STRA|nr:expressed unknown protein [Seminavis robusta]|eukprot:Sro300_g111650.1 n/a (284) ;mRNA; f:16226-17077